MPAHVDARSARAPPTSAAGTDSAAQHPLRRWHLLLPGQRVAGTGEPGTEGIAVLEADLAEGSFAGFGATLPPAMTGQLADLRARLLGGCGRRVAADGGWRGALTGRR